MVRVLEKLNSNASGDFDIHWGVNLSSNVALPDVDPVQSPLISDGNKSQLEFYARESISTYTCMFKIWIYHLLKEYLVSMLVFMAVSAFIVYKLRACVMNRRAGKLARDLFNDVKGNLEKNGQSFAGLSKNDIMRMYMGMPKISDNLKRDEHTFRNTVWPLVEYQRKNDR